MMGYDLDGFRDKNERCTTCFGAGWTEEKDYPLGGWKKETCRQCCGDGKKRWH